MKRIAIISTHPIQYYAPVFRLLHQRGVLAIRVFYTLGEQALDAYDPGFGQAVRWDIPLLEGYPYEWVPNTSTQPGSRRFRGIVNPGLADQVSLWEPEAVLIVGWAYDSHLKAMRYFKGKLPVFFRGDSILPDKEPMVRGFLRKCFLKWVYRHTDYAFYNGQQNKRYFLAFGLSEKQLLFAPHAVDNERFGQPEAEAACRFRAELGIPENALVVLFAGKMEAVKRTGLLLNAFIRAGHPGAFLVLVGDGPLTGELRSQAAGRPGVRFAGFRNQTEMPAVYQSSDIFCLPSESETWGLSVNEAMACGKAVLVSDHCGCAADLVVPGKNGYIFKSGSAGELADRLSDLLADPEQLRKFGAASLRLIRDWNFTNIADAIEKGVTQMTCDLHE